MAPGASGGCPDVGAAGAGDCKVGGAVGGATFGNGCGVCASSAATITYTTCMPLL